MRLLLVGLAVVIALSAGLLGSEPERQWSVDQIMQDPGEFEHAQIHIRGAVSNGTYNSSAATFQLDGAQHSLTIDFTGVAIPNAFQEGRTVAVKGQLRQSASGWTLLAEEIITGCPSKYSAEESAD
jgi:cytochrome c-type biogenesis protein CcmE